MLSYFDTPLGPRPEWPGSRPGGLAAELLPVFIGGTEDVRAKLRHPDVLAITTGQQPGLFTGPLYTIHKALSARALASLLERRWQRPVVPVFWLAGDDHDYAEATAAHWLGPDGALMSMALEPRPVAAPQRPMSREPVPARAVELLAELVTALPDGPARDQTIDWLGRHYRTDASLAQAFGGALAEVLGPLGILCFDATAPAAKAAAAPTILAAARRAGELDRLLVTRAADLEAAGQNPGVKVGDGATLAFLDGPGGRDRLVLDPAGYRTRRGGEMVSDPELARIAREEPTRLSPNVLLRPVIESALLPTVGYVAGPGELRYLALAEALYEPLGVVKQLAVPRWSGVVVEPRVTRSLEKFGATMAELFDGPAQVEQRVLHGLVPPDFDPAFAEARQRIEAGYDRIMAVAKAIDPTLLKPAAATRSGALTGLGDLEKRLLQAQKRRQGEVMAQLDRARTAIRPGGAPQERVIGLPALAGRYGIGFLSELADHIDAWYRRALEGGAPTA